MKQFVTQSAIVLAMLATNPAWGSDDGILRDRAGDAVIRRTDAGNNAPLPQGFVPIDLLEMRMEGWEPFSPQTDPYSGDTSGGDEDIMRIQIVVDGLVAPPGPIGLDASPFEPYMFGDRPLFGYFEIDIDDQKNTGGEMMPLAQNRYLANVGRFGEVPDGSFGERMVREPGDLDDSFSTLPQFERTGGEFAIAMCGCFTPTIVSQDGDMDSRFDPGETWVVRGRFFERFIAFAPESGMFGGSDFGLFDPMVDLQFKHDIATDKTTVTLVFPITNAGAAMLSGQPEQPLDLNVANQTSIEEALDDLIYGADFASGDLSELTDGWRGRDTDDYYRPRDWHAIAIVGTVSTEKDPSALFVWTDVGFDEVRGDFDGTGIYALPDNDLLESTIDQRDGGADDGDGAVNGEVLLSDFPREFSVFDLNSDGRLDAEDLADVPTYSVEPIAYFDFFATVRGISNTGLVVGDQFLGLNQPFVASMEGGLQTLPLPSGYVRGFAHDVNDRGVIVGSVSDDPTTTDDGEPAVWIPDNNGGYTVSILNQFTQLPDANGTPTAIDGGSAVAINNNDTIVGWSRFAGDASGLSTRFFLDGPPLDLRADGFTARARDLNDNGVVVGGGQRLNLTSGELTELGLPPEEDDDVDILMVDAVSINNQGLMVVVALRNTTGLDRWSTYLYDDLQGWVRYNPNHQPTFFRDIPSSINNNGDISAPGGARFAPERILAEDYAQLLADEDSEWNPQFGFIDDDRRIFAVAFDTSTAESAIVMLVPDGLIPPCPADLTGDGVLNFFDVSAFLSAFGTQQPPGDFNGDGNLDFFDVSAFLSAFHAGCP